MAYQRMVLLCVLLVVVYAAWASQTAAPNEVMAVTCMSFHCSNISVHLGNLTCPKSRCTAAHCCQITCASLAKKCPSGSLVFNATKPCKSKTKCKAQECCIGACSKYKKACPANYKKKATSPTDIICAAQACKPMECCQLNLGNCSAFNCMAVKKSPKPNPASITCNKTKCNPAECCLGNCAGFTCLPPKKLVDAPATVLCKGLTCLDTECCIDAPNTTPQPIVLDTIQLFWTVSNGIITFTLAGIPQDNWAGVGWGASSMAGGFDICTAQPGNMVVDRLSAGHFRPPPDPQQDCIWKSTEMVGTSSKITFSKALTTSDTTTDKPLAAGSISLAIAYGQFMFGDITHHTNKNVFTVTLY